MSSEANFEYQHPISDWYMPWDIVDVLISGRSSIDLPRLYVKSLEEAREFVRSYGFDPDSAEDQRLMHSMIIESLAFIANKLMPLEWSEGQLPPKEVLYCDDPCQLILMASSSEGQLQAWACAVLRVLHTISHIEDVKKIVNMNQARQQIIQRFQSFIFRDSEGRLWLGSKKLETEEDIKNGFSKKVHLEKFESKSLKTRDSIILKLLHKRANIAETIYDLVGVRIVAKTALDAVLVVKYLRELQLVSYPNTHPARARNTLMDADKFQVQLRSLLEFYESGVLNEDEFYKLLKKIIVQPSHNPRINPHTFVSYRSIQLTCRQLVRMRDPALFWVDKVRKSLADEEIKPEKRAVLGEFIEFIDSWTHFAPGRSDLSFFPYEVQILDRDSYLQNQYGAASYDRYKQSQVKTARKRVLGPLIKRAAQI
ncbi:MAG: TIGR04552 family protein [Oligoflexales bacterium]|nr:TIGR04552 family protein [Oligoflexales bacterium]